MKYIKSECSSKFFGVRFRKDRNKFAVRVILDGKRNELGCCFNEIDAAQIYDDFIKSNNLNRRLNFPEPEPENLIPNTKLIRLTQGKFAIVDEDIFEVVNKYKWTALKTKYTYYAQRTIHFGNKSTSLTMHRFIMGNSESDIDHQNRNGLHNYKSNLRFCTHSQNMMNKSPHSNCVSKYKGVSLNPQKNCFQSKITLNKKTQKIGDFINEIDAANSYDKYAKELFGEFACLNFPD